MHVRIVRPFAVVARPLIVTAVAAAGLLGLSAGALVTEDPVDLGGDAFVDTTGEFSSDADDLNAFLDQHNAEAEADLYAVVVDGFDGMDRGEWAVQSAEASGLPQDALLITIAWNDGQWGRAVANAYPLSASEVDQVAQQSLVPALNNGDVAGGVMAMADAIDEAVASGGTGGS